MTIKRSNDPLSAAISSQTAPQPFGKQVKDAIESGKLTVDDMPYVIAHLLAQLDA